MKKFGQEGKQKWVITNNGEITFAYTDAMNRFDFSARSYTRALDELIQKGFLSVKKPGDIGGKLSTYSLDTRWERYGKKDFVKAERMKSNRNLGFMKKQN